MYENKLTTTSKKSEIKVIENNINDISPKYNFIK